MNHVQRLVATPPTVEVTAAGPAADVAAAAQLAEEHGVERLYTAEAAYDPFQALAVAASRTSRIELATGVAVAFARTPMTLASSAWTLQETSGGRAVIGLGSQVKAHVTRRFSMPWSSPAARMREFVMATRAIWDGWQKRESITFQGDFYTHTLMTPTFTPERLEQGPPKLLIAAVGPSMTRVAGQVGDGLLCHPFSSPSYLGTRVIPRAIEARLEAAASIAAWSRFPFEIAGSVITATGRTRQQYNDSVREARNRIAFYASTPAYRPVLDHHGWGPLQDELHALARHGRWKEMGDLIDDEMLCTFAVVAESTAAAGHLLRERCTGLFHRVSPSICGSSDLSLALEVLATARE
ncbi:TIGR03617 family F420-dependent LLM class oxidoreductase [Streptomyces sp. NPDC056069]|uniref:TIGR03617 family F420-dependent LLM class oxidoreductase n=1 Tax=Streptomyces sp. NPDC056069 TaxID=3345702 RepID=UPI0035D7EEE9